MPRNECDFTSRLRAAPPGKSDAIFRGDLSWLSLQAVYLDRAGWGDDNETITRPGSPALSGSFSANPQLPRLMPKHPKSSRVSAHFIKRLSSWLVLSTALTLAVRSATTLYWDTDNSTVDNDPITGTNLGGGGTWDDQNTANWWEVGQPDNQS